MSTVYALAGNPNSGKTTLFNELTGSRQHVGNWPGVTVEKKEGYLKPRSDGIRVVDLPGLYSLSPCSDEERAARRFLLDDKPDVILNIVDATNLERNLYLTLQLAELGRPMVIALNMTDRLRSKGLEIDVLKLQSRLGIPIVSISASRGLGIHNFLKIAQNASHNKTTNGNLDDLYSAYILGVIKNIEKTIDEKCSRRSIPLRWAAVRLLDDDAEVRDLLRLNPEEKRRLDEIMNKLEADNKERDMIIADQKYRSIVRICSECVRRVKRSDAPEISDLVDRVATHRLFALPLFLSLMAAVFFLTFGTLGAWLSGSLESAIKTLLVPWLRTTLEGFGAADWAVSLICEGIFGGVGSVVAFLPQLLLLFFFLSILEDSGYMARAAFLMDRVLCKTGLSGRSFVPMLMGFGCTVSGVMAARTLNSRRDKRMTILLTPFLSCSAKMPVYALFTAAFFPAPYAAVVVICLYAAGVAVALMTAWALRKTVFRGEHAPFLMELPPYRLPTPKTMWRNMSQRVRDFTARAGTVLLLASVVIWFLREFDPGLHRLPAGHGGESILANIGRLLVPLLAPLGLGFWQAAVALVTGLFAKEAIVGTLTILYHPAANATISSALQGAFTPVSALSLLVFVLLYAPCVAAFSTIRRELHSAKWAVGWSLIQTGIAWVAAFMVYQFGTLAVNLSNLL